ncbi:cytochrome P450 [Sistotremastrum suecicum HHB10207 ss-3]|uniref:Cytochrome P450 n=1 Tax=Sistotremastrum suecicum HHB10207 ss-3 TaxID=1314776 RepID=A0A166HJT7_9AGAM|nr:cytochrome P450 [Sistotremastrum suecicum HHB10207 ss-3]
MFSLSLLAISFTLLKVLGLLLLVPALYLCVWLVHMLYIAPRFDTLDNMPGPLGGKLETHLNDMMNPNITSKSHGKFIEKYGFSWRFNGFGSFDLRLLTLDPRALAYILNSPAYQKPVQTRRLLSTLLGKGIFAAEGDAHKRQRKVINPAFTAQSVRGVAPIFFDKAEKLCRKITAETTAGKEGQSFDMYHLLGRLAFDIIGAAGFGWEFHALDSESEEVYLAYRRMFGTMDAGPGPKLLLDLQFPWLPKIWADERNRIISRSKKTIHTWGAQVIEDRKQIMASEKGTSQDKSILSVLLKANMEESNNEQRLSDAELLDQLSTFLFGGSDSVSIAIVWCLHLLSLHLTVQSSLREELASFRSMDADDQTSFLDSCPLLEYVVKESLRLAPPVHSTIRMATKDDLIPVSRPVTMRDGTLATHIPIKKGSYIHIPMEAFNLCKDIWGSDADEFKPERWTDLPPAARSHLGLAGLMTFSFGPHSCPGFRFALLEIKVVVAVLITQFDFAPAETIKRFNAVVSRPAVVNDGQFDSNASLPLKVTSLTL